MEMIADAIVVPNNKEPICVVCSVVSRQERVKLLQRMLTYTERISDSTPGFKREEPIRNFFSDILKAEYLKPITKHALKIRARELEEKPAFKDVFDMLRNKKEIRKSLAAIYREAGVDKDTFSRLRNKDLYNRIGAGKARDAVYALAIVMKLDLNETDQLLISIGQTLRGTLTGEYDPKREALILTYIESGTGDLSELNDLLFEEGYSILGV